MNDTWRRNVTDVWTTKSGYEAGVIATKTGQWRACTRKIGETAWIEIGKYYTTVQNARNACEELAEKYNENRELW